LGEVLVERQTVCGLMAGYERGTAERTFARDPGGTTPCPRAALILTRSANEPAFIFSITRPRMGLYRDLADAEVCAELLVQAAHYRERHDLALAATQRLISIT